MNGPLPHVPVSVSTVKGVEIVPALAQTCCGAEKNGRGKTQTDHHLPIMGENPEQAVRSQLAGLRRGGGVSTRENDTTSPTMGTAWRVIVPGWKGWCQVQIHQETFPFLHLPLYSPTTRLLTTPPEALESHLSSFFWVWCPSLMIEHSYEQPLHKCESLNVWVF